MRTVSLIVFAPTLLLFGPSCQSKFLPEIEPHCTNLAKSTLIMSKLPYRQNCSEVTGCEVEDRIRSSINNTFHTYEDIPLQIPLHSLQTNTSQLLRIDNVKNGTVSLFGETLIFTPKKDFHGIASFEYLMSQNNQHNKNFLSISIRASADEPNLLANNIVVDPKRTIPLEIRANLVDKDGSEELSLLLEGLPKEASLSTGQSGESIHLRPEDLSGLAIIAPENFHGKMLLNITAETREVSNLDSSASMVSFQVNVTPALNGVSEK